MTPRLSLVSSQSSTTFVHDLSKLLINIPDGENDQRVNFNPRSQKLPVSIIIPLTFICLVASSQASPLHHISFQSARP